MKDWFTDCFLAGGWRSVIFGIIMAILWYGLLCGSLSFLMWADDVMYTKNYAKLQIESIRTAARDKEVAKWKAYATANCISYDQFLKVYGQPLRVTKGDNVTIAQWEFLGPEYTFDFGCCTSDLCIEVIEEIIVLKRPDGEGK